MSAQYDIKMISSQQTLPLRRAVLKPFLSENECVNPADELASTYHLGLFVNEKLISIASFNQEPHSAFKAVLPYRLRGMATAHEYHGQGFGRILLNHGTSFLRAQGCDFLWFNARIKAFPFYEKLGFSYYGLLFDMKDIGPHKVMYKILDPK